MAVESEKSGGVFIQAGAFIRQNMVTLCQFEVIKYNGTANVHDQSICVLVCFWMMKIIMVIMGESMRKLSFKCQ